MNTLPFSNARFGHVHWFAFCVLVTALICTYSSYSRDGNSGLAFDPFDDFTIRQRVGCVGAMPISGSVGAEVSALEFRVVDAKSGEDVIGWRKIDAEIVNGAWHVTIEGIPQGGWYNVHVRSADDHNVMAECERRFGIGVIIVFAGQSNLFANAGSPYRGDAPEFWKGSTMSSLLSNRPLIDGTTQWKPNRGPASTFYRLLGANLVERLDVPVGLVNAAWGGTRIFDWTNETQKVKDDEDAVFERYQKMMAYAGGDAELLVWHQGWSDFGPIVKTPTHYEEQLDILYDRLTSEIARKEISILSGVEGRRIPNTKKELLEKLDRLTIMENKWADYVRWSQMRWAKNHDYVLKGPNTIDIRLNDHCHFDSKDRILWASRMTQCILFALGEEAYSGGGVDIDPRSVCIDGKTVSLRVKHEGGDSLTVPFPDEPIEGFVVSNDGFENRLAIEDVEIVQPDTIKIELAETPSGEVQVIYLGGPSPICDILLDPDSEDQEPMASTPPGNILYDNAVLPPGNFRTGLGSMVNGTIGPVTAVRARGNP